MAAGATVRQAEFSGVELQKNVYRVPGPAQ